MIGADGWRKFNIWEHSATVRELYARRCRDEAGEMTCHAQAAALLAPHVSPGDTLLDAGCGSGYFFHSLRKRGIAVEYFGIDATRCLVELGQRYLPPFGLPAANLQTLRIEDMDGEADHVVCINVLSNIDNYHRPLERLMLAARKTIIVRESCSDSPSYAYVKDRYLDAGAELNVHVNTYPAAEFAGFMESYGFDVATVRDERTSGEPEMVIGYPHHWKIFVGTKKSRAA